jgi:adenylylsulfate kinase
MAASNCQASEGMTIWLTGLPSAGKTTIGSRVTEQLRAAGFHVEFLDGDVIRKRLFSELGFTKHDRDENVLRLAFLANLLSRHGVIVVVAAIAPYRAIRQRIRDGSTNFVEVYINASSSVCEQRDVKGLYRKARRGELTGFTGIDDPYEAPLLPEVEFRTDRETIAESTTKVLRYISDHLSAPAPGDARNRLQVDSAPLPLHGRNVEA